MKKKSFSPAQVAALRVRFERCKQQIMALDWLSEGSVTENHPGTWRWTRKVKAKTVSVALSKEQYQALQQAIENWRELQEILRRMQALSRRVIFETLPNPPRRKRLGKKVLGLV